MLLLFDGESIAVDMLRGLGSLKLMWSTDEEDSSIAHWETLILFIFYLSLNPQFMEIIYSHLISFSHKFTFTLHSPLLINLGKLDFSRIFQ